MSDPRFRPRDYARDEFEFGRAEEIDWRDVPASELLRQRAAVIQHYLVYSMREALESADASISELAETAGVSYDRMARVLRGDVLMRLEDIAAADILLPGFFPNQVDAYLRFAALRWTGPPPVD